MKKYNVFWFDLDETIWRTLDKHAYQIWAKQMIEPFVLDINEEFISDDVRNENFLFEGVKEVWQELRKNNKVINVVSCGAKYESFDQPSEKLLKMHKLVPDRLFLAYKTFRKVDLLKEENEPFVLFDDNIKQLQEVSTLSNAYCFNIHSFDNGWKDLL